MNKREFIELYARNRAIPKSVAKVEVDTFLKTLRESLKKDSGVVFSGDFSLKKKKYPARNRVLNGTVYDEKEHYGIVFHPSDELRKDIY